MFFYGKMYDFSEPLFQLFEPPKNHKVSNSSCASLETMVPEGHTEKKGKRENKSM